MKINKIDAYEMKKSGFTYKEIGKKYGASGQAVLNLLKSNFPDIKFKNLSIKEKKDFKCPQCGITKKVVLSSIQKYCSKTCWRNFHKEYILTSGLPTNSIYATDEQKKEFNRIRAKKFYEKNKNNPEYKEYLKRHMKLYQKKKKEEYKIYKEFYLKNKNI